MVKKSILFLAIAVALFAAPAFGQGLSYHAGHGATGGDCAACHDNSPAATLRGWGSTADPGSALQWYGRPIAKLCWSCHRTGGGGSGATNMDSYAFDNASHGYDTAVVYAPDNTTVESYAATGLPYATLADIDCTTCHNVHNNAFRPFSMEGSSATNFNTLCTKCHVNRINAGNVGAANALGNHPTDVNVVEIGANTTTIKATIDARFTNGTVGAAWVLGGKLAGLGTAQATTAMSCQTCHPVHGGPAAFHTEDLLAINNNAATVGGDSDLCKGCHGGGDGVTNVGRNATNNTDHPIDAVTGWAFYPPASAFTVYGTAAGMVPNNWKTGARPNTGATQVNASSSAGGGPACSSCHDVHGGIAATSCLYGPNNTATIDQWCFNCHSASGLVPNYHHSTDGNWVDSQLVCGDCHGDGSGTWKAHNGFAGFRVALSTTNSLFCEACHVPADPMTFQAGSHTPAWTTAQADWPATHAAKIGTESHTVNTAFAIDRVARSTTFNWATAFGYSGTFPTAVSEFNANTSTSCESCHNIITNCGPLVSPATALEGGWRANLLLAPYEDDTPGTTTGARANGQFASNPGDLLCRVCHNSVTNTTTAAATYNPAGTAAYVHYPGAHTIPAFNYVTMVTGGVTPYNRTTATILTTPNDSTVAGDCPNVSTADNTAGPLAFSYPAANQVNCDSCHRPHGAGVTTSGDDAGDSGKVIVQRAVVSPAKTAPCADCHNINTMCGY